MSMLAIFMDKIIIALLCGMTSAVTVGAGKAACHGCSVAAMSWVVVTALVVSKLIELTESIGFCHGSEWWLNDKVLCGLCATLTDPKYI